MSFDSGALSIWINVILAVAAIGGVLSIAALVLLLRPAPSARRSPVRRSAHLLPEHTLEGPAASADRAA